MKSFFRICVVISTVLVLGTSNPQNYQRPGTNHEWRNQEMQQNFPPHQWSNYQKSVPSLSPVPESVNYQRVHRYPIEVNSFAPINANEATQDAQRASHTHRIRKISMPLKDLNKQEGTRVIQLPPNGDPKELKIMLIGDDNRTVYEENNVPESVKEILARALAVNRGEARIIHSESPVNEQPVYESANAQSVNVQSVNDQSVNAQPVNAQSLYAKSISVQSANDQSVNAQSVNVQSVNDQSVNAQSVYVQPIKAQSIYAKSVSVQSVNDQSVNRQPINDQSVNTHPINAHPMNAQLINNQLVNAQSVNTHPNNAHSVKAQSFNAQPINDQPINAQSANAHPINAQSIHAKSVSVQSVNDQSVNRQPINDQSVNTYPINAQPVNAQPINAQPINAESVQVQPINAQSGNAHPMNAQLINNQLVNAQSVNTHPNNAHSVKAQSFNAQPINDQPINDQSVNAQLVNTQPINVQSVNAHLNITHSVKVQSVNAQPINDQPINAESANAQPINAQPVNAQLINAQTVNAESIHVQPINAQSDNTQPINVQSANAHPNITRSIKAQSVNAQPTNDQPINAQPINDQPVNAQPVNVQPINAQPINAQNVGNATSRPAVRPRPRYSRLRGSKGPLYPAIARPYRRRRPFQRHPKIRGPARRPDRILVTSNKPKAATVANNTGAILKPEGVIPKNANIKTTDRQPKEISDGQPKDDSFDKEPTIIRGQDHNIIIQQVDSVKSTTSAPADKYVDDYLDIASKPNQPTFKPDIPQGLDSPNGLPDNTIQYREAPISGLIDGISVGFTVPTPKAPVQLTLHDYVPTYPKATIPTDDDYLYPIASAKSADAIAAPKSVPTTEVDISSIILQTKENKLTPVPTTSNDGIIPIDTKLGKTGQDNEPSIVTLKTTLTESTQHPIHMIDTDDVPLDVSTSITSTTVTEPTPVSTIPNGDDSFLFATKLLQSLFTTASEYSSITPETTTITTTPLPTNPNNDDDVPIATKLSETLLTEIDDLASTTIISTTVTEPTPIPTNQNDDDSFLFTTKLIQSLLTTDNDDSTELTPVSTEMNNYSDNESDIVSSTSEPAPDLASTNLGISELSQTVTKSNLAPIKSLTTDSLPNNFNGLHVDTLPPFVPFHINELPDEVKQNNYPYVIISRLPPEDNTTTEPSLFTTLIDYIIGNKEMTVPKTGVKDITELKLKSGDEYLEGEYQEKSGIGDSKKNYVFSSLSDNLDNMAKATIETHANLKETGYFDQEKQTINKANEKERKTMIEDDKTVTADDSEESIVITSADVANLYETGPMTPLTFIVSLVRSALQGADSLRALFSDQRVKDFILEIIHI